MVNESIVQTFDGFMRNLINFKTELLGLRHNDRYSTETENLVKLIHKYMEKCHRIQHKSSAEPNSEKSVTDGVQFIDLIEEKERRYYEITSQYKVVKEERDSLLERIKVLESDNKEMEKQLLINNKHEEIQAVFSKLSALLLANKVDMNSSLKYSEREIINKLFKGKS